MSMTGPDFPDFTMQELSQRAAGIRRHILSSVCANAHKQCVTSCFLCCVNVHHLFMNCVVTRPQVRNCPVRSLALGGRRLPGKCKKKHAHRVPAHVQALIPEAIQKAIGCWQDVLVVVRDLEFLDVCAGKARMCKWGEMAGLNVAAIDRSHAKHMNLTTVEGLGLAVVMALRVVCGGLMFLGPQCSTWVWMSRSQTKRSQSRPLGDASSACVREGNDLNAAVALVCAIAHEMGVFWVLEQPSTSLFCSTAAMSRTIATTQAARASFAMSLYGHTSRKHTLLYGTPPWLHSYQARATKRSNTEPLTPLTTTTVGKGGIKATTGRRAYLQASQVYPVKFALAIMRSHWPDRFPRFGVSDGNHDMRTSNDTGVKRTIGKMKVLRRPAAMRSQPVPRAAKCSPPVPRAAKRSQPVPRAAKCSQPVP